jgi:hypothetical protein
MGIAKYINQVLGIIFTFFGKSKIEYKYEYKPSKYSGLKLM